MARSQPAHPPTTLEGAIDELLWQLDEQAQKDLALAEYYKWNDDKSLAERYEMQANARFAVIELMEQRDKALRLLAAAKDPTDEEEVCDACGGTGYLLDQTYGYATWPEGWVPVQRCDTCGKIDTDQQAARQAAVDKMAATGHSRLIDVRYWHAEPDAEEDDDHPGDWAIFLMPK